MPVLTRRQAAQLGEAPEPSAFLSLPDDLLLRCLGFLSQEERYGVGRCRERVGSHS